MQTSKRLIVYGGAFNPPTAAHLAAIRVLAARQDGVLVLLPSGAQFIRQWKDDQTVLPDVTRLDLLQRNLEREGLSQVLIDCLAMRENLCTYDALERLKAAHGAEEALFVIGEDKLDELPRWAHARALAASTRFLLLNYEKTGAAELALPGLSVPVRVEYVRLPAGTERVHASALREKMRRHDPAPLEENGPLTAYPECVRLAACSPQVYLGNPARNAEALIRCMERTDGDILVFPELAISGYTCADLFLSPAFLDGCERAAAQVAAATARTGQVVFFGCPVRAGNRLYNCAAAAQGGEIIALIPKVHLANYGEFYERRWFASGDEGTLDRVRFAGYSVPFGSRLLLRSNRGKAVIGAEICEDAWVPLPPSMRHAAAGANIIVNLSASNDLVAKVEYRRDMLRMLSARGICAYVYASSGAGESSSDVVYGGQRMILLNGRVLAQAVQPLSGADEACIAATVDLSMLESDRLRMNSFSQAPDGAAYGIVPYAQATYRFPPQGPGPTLCPRRRGRSQKETLPGNPSFAGQGPVSAPSQHRHAPGRHRHQRWTGQHPGPDRRSHRL